MTTDHPGHGRLQAHLDGELSLDAADAVERHVARCPDCRARLEALAAAERTVSGALGLLDRGAPTSDERAELLWDLRRRHARRRAERHRRRLAVAASTVLLLAAGAAAAMPGSPVRDWLAGGDRPEAELHTAAAPAEGAALSLEPVEGRARVELATEGPTALEVRMGTGERVEVEAPEAASFQAGIGWVRVSGAGAGTVRVELPAAGETRVLVDGRLRVEVREGALRIDGDEISRATMDAGEWIPVPEGGP